MTNEQTEDLKEILINLLDETQNLTGLCSSLNRKLEAEKVNILKIQNQLSIVNCVIPDTQKEVDRLKNFIDNMQPS